MVNPVRYRLDTQDGPRLIIIEPVYEEITGRDLVATGRYILTEQGAAMGEIRFDGMGLGFVWNGENRLEDENISQIAKFIEEYNEPELAGYSE